MAINNEYNPAVVKHPGRILKRELDARDMRQKEFAVRAGLTEKLVSDIINGKAAITAERAIAFETVLGISAQLWTNLQLKYDENQAKKSLEEGIKKDIELLNEVPYSTIQKIANFLPSTKDKAEKIFALRDMWGVSSLHNLFSNPSVLPESAFFRTTGLVYAEGKTPNKYSLSAWLCIGKKDAQNLSVNSYNERQLWKVVPQIKSCSGISDVSEGWKKVKAILFECGVKISLVPYITGLYVNGAIMWIGGNPIIILNNKGTYLDAFWFTLLHEIGHILLHGKDTMISYERKAIADDQQEYIQKEAEADAFARNALLPDETFKSFVSGDYMSNILSFANANQVAPSIVIGRLAKEGFIPWSHPICKRRVQIVITQNDE